MLDFYEFDTLSLHAGQTVDKEFGELIGNPGLDIQDREAGFRAARKFSGD